MRGLACLVFWGALLLLLHAGAANAKGTRLADLTWVEAKAAFAKDPVIVIPLGAAAKEHGPHLRLDADFRQAEWFAARLLDDAKRSATEVIVAPTMSYGYYPAFVEYPGSTNVSEGVARDFIIDVVRSLAKHGPRKFYVLNIGISTNKPLSQARAILVLEGIAFSYFDMTAPVIDAVDKLVRAQSEGTHADELETSIMLAIEPRRVDMKQAVKELGPGKNARGAFSPSPDSPRPSPSGIYGDATLASKQKGRTLLDGYAKEIRTQIEALAKAAPPEPVNIYGVLTPTPPPPPRAPTTPPTSATTTN